MKLIYYLLVYLSSTACKSACNSGNRMNSDDDEDAGVVEWLMVGMVTARMIMRLMKKNTFES